MFRKLDKKDLAILQELDLNYRTSFSSISRKINLSKNSVMLRFEKLQPFITHAITAINYDGLGFTQVRVFYSFDYYNNNIENKISKELLKYPNVMWAGKYYGHYDLCICFIIKDLGNFVQQINLINNKFKNIISQVHFQIIVKQTYFRHNYLHKKPIFQQYYQRSIEERLSISKTEKKILESIAFEPRKSVIRISKETHLTTKTISNNIKQMEQRNLIKGFYMTLKTSEFGYDSFKLLIQVHNVDNNKGFMDYLASIKNVRYIAKEIGLWDYEIDFIYPHISDLQKELEQFKEKYSSLIKHMEILSLGERIMTNKHTYF